MPIDQHIQQHISSLKTEVDWRKRNEAIDALNEIHTDEAFQAIVGAFEDENANVVAHAVEGLARFGKQAVPALIEALSRPDRMPLMSIIQNLQNIGDPRALPALKQLVDSSDDRIASRSVAAVISLMGPADAKIFVYEGLKSSRQWFQRQCARTAAKFGLVEAIPILYEELTEPAPPYSYIKRKYPALALGTLGEPALEYLLKASYHEDGEVRQAVAEGLTLISGTKATNRLIELMDDPYHSVHDVATMYIGERDDINPTSLLETRLDPARPSVFVLAGLGNTGRLEAVPVILRALEQEQYKTAEALYSLSHRYWNIPVLSEDTSRVPELGEALESNDNRLVITAIWVLGSLSYPHSQHRKQYREEHNSLEGFEIPIMYHQILGYLTPMLSHSDAYVRYAATHIIHYVGDESVIPTLNRILAEDMPYVALEAIDTLSRLKSQGIDTTGATPGLIAAMQRHEAMIARRATLALGYTGDASSTEILLELTDHTNAETRSLAAHTLGGHRQERVLLRLLHLLQHDPVMRVRHSAAFALHSFHDVRAIKPLVRILNEVGSDPKATYELRQWAAMDLAHFDDQLAISALLDAVDNAPEWQIKMHAIDSLGQMGDSWSCADRLFRLLEHQDSVVRTVAANRLGFIGTGTDDENLRADIVQQLVPKLSDRGRGHLLRPTVAYAAATSLRYIGTEAAQTALKSWEASTTDE